MYTALFLSRLLFPLLMISFIVLNILDSQKIVLVCTAGAIIVISIFDILVSLVSPSIASQTSDNRFVRIVMETAPLNEPHSSNGRKFTLLFICIFALMCTIYLGVTEQPIR